MNTKHLDFFFHVLTACLESITSKYSFFRYTMENTKSMQMLLIQYDIK